MLPFAITLRTGVPIYEQVIYAVARAIVKGDLRPGDPFPSVRTLSHALKINPNTAHKIVSALIERQILVVRPGVGTVVGELSGHTTAAQRALLEEKSERLVVHAKQAGLGLQDVLTAIRAHWAATSRRAG